ncbi:TonB-dependent receptor [Luteimonas sp. SX5]|uniref:TonB-dependent receptor n=1 Tax=Luteimonas galliterrae TaxID=2940486 RepID=A0ABT0MJ67_9GAMM|nr:TonB-dependent receptor [Luteimonas galliterrae]MCL1634718.1 TonB-dependent receptor [Luteimonas galliterrae]
MRNHYQLLKRSTLGAALALCFAGGVQAQSNTAGTVSGRAASGDTITVTSSDTGFSRTISVGQDGGYRLSQLPPGKYTVTRKGSDGATNTRDVVVNVGTASNVDFVAPSAGDAAQLETVTVIGTGAINPIDVSSVESSTILTEEAIDRLPVGRDTTSVALLAPGTVRSDSFGNVASFGGSSAAENAYYINGFNVTNIRNGLAYNEVPFEGIAETQVKTGGYGAEFGRSLGGVVNVITKRGTNEWTFGGSAYYTPNSLRSSFRREDLGSDGRWGLVDAEHEQDELIYNVYGSGPILKDRLFLFALYQGNKTETDLYGTNFTNLRRGQFDKSNNDKGLVKIDWNITDSHVIELTAFRDREETTRDVFQLLEPWSKRLGAFQGTQSFVTGGDNYIAKWTGYFGDNFTLSALAGRGEYRNASITPNTDCPFVQDNRPGQPSRRGCAVAAAFSTEDAGDDRDAYRIDAEWVLGDHTLRFGLDREEINSIAKNESSGGISFTIDPVGDAPLPPGTIVPPGTTAIVTAREFSNGGEFSTKNQAYYLEDSWQISDTFLAYAGIRNESFENLNADGIVFAKKDDTWAPRLGFSWDVNGDSTTKVFGNAGRYYIPIMTNTNVRLSGAERDIQTYFVFDGTFSGGRFDTPVLGQQIARVVQSTGVAADPRSVVDDNLSPLFQDEYILGFQQQLTDKWSAGIRAIHRKMSSGMDDYCAYQAPHDWAAANGFSSTPDDEVDGEITSEADAIGEGTAHCFLMNPGQDLSANIDINGDGTLEKIKIPASALRLPTPTRTYNALEFFFERVWDGKWTMQGSYTWSKSIGNTEGYVKSDIAQPDAGLTQDFDFAELMENSYGYLPNDRRHALKIFGSYQIADEWRIGANLIVQSGRPLNCFGDFPEGRSKEKTLYTNSSFFCDGVAAPRGTRGRLDWTRNLGLQVAYEPKWAAGLWAKLDVFNVTDESTVTSVRERQSPRNRHLQPLTWQAPRSVRLSVGYDFSL